MMKISLTTLYALFVFVAFAQPEDYKYKRELSGINDQWHSIELPDAMFGKLSKDLSDIRIYGFNKNDTIQAAYLLKESKPERKFQNISFHLSNQSRKGNAYFFTFEIPELKTINQIQLNFKNKNFDWKIKLEGSQTREDWQTIVDNYRILSIDNNSVKFNHTSISLPASDFRFYRLTIPATVKPEFERAEISFEKFIPGKRKLHKTANTNITENKELQQTEIKIKLAKIVPVSQLDFIIADNFDYYRPVTIQYLSDSIKTENGMKHRYRTITSATLNSLKENSFSFPTVFTNRLKIIIRNENNQALDITGVEVYSNSFELIARFTEECEYFLYYGNNKAPIAHYDIERFPDKIPETAVGIMLGNEMTNDVAVIEKKDKSAIFENSYWLWLILAALGVMMGFFTIKMIRSKS